MIRFKPDVRIVEFTPQLAELLGLCSLWSLRSRIDVEINSIDDSTHGLHGATLHGASLAVDADTVGDAPADTAALGGFLRRRLSSGWDVVDEGNHVHAEWDTHRPALRQTT